VGLNETIHEQAVKKAFCKGNPKLRVKHGINEQYEQQQ
jgi:hypothetical protein